MVVLFVFNNQKIYISCLCLDYFSLHKLFYCLFLCLFASSVWLGWSLHRLNQYRICKELETYINIDIHVLHPKETETLIFGENCRNDRVQFLKIPGIHAHNLRGWLYRAGKHLHKSRDQGLRQLLFVPLEKTTIVVIHALCTMHCSVIALKHVLYMQFS